MSRTINIETDQFELIKNLQKVIQSTNLNFLIGSGYPNPALKDLGNVEQKPDSYTLQVEKISEVT